MRGIVSSSSRNLFPVFGALQGDPCTITAQSYLGGSPNDRTPAIAFDVREVPAPTVAFLQAGDLAIAGVASPPFSAPDTGAALVFVAPGSLTPVFGRLFGGPGDEFFFSPAENRLAGGQPSRKSHNKQKVREGDLNTGQLGLNRVRIAYRIRTEHPTGDHNLSFLPLSL